MHFNESIKIRVGKEKEETICSEVSGQTSSYPNLVSVLPLAPMYVVSTIPGPDGLIVTVHINIYICYTKKHQYAENTVRLNCDSCLITVSSIYYVFFEK